MLGRPLDSLRVVSCHLGAGASLAAVREGRSVDTTMGFTPLAGLVMQTRSGSVDPGLVTWLLEHGGLDAETLTAALEHQSGLRGLTGTSGDIREVLAGRARGDADCALAFDVYVHTLVREIGAMAASAGGLDLLVFTGGVGEHAPAIRAGAVDGLGFLGLAVDGALNESAGSDDHEITASGSTARIFVIQAREDLEMAANARSVLGRAT
jgi:acetate kinase